MKRFFIQTFRPSERLNFILLVVFAIAAVLYGSLPLAGTFAGVLVVLGLYTSAYKVNRRRRDLRGIGNTLYGAEEAGADALTALPMPAAVFSLADGTFSWSNEQFLTLVGAREHIFDTMLSDYLPNFDYKWLIDHKSEAPELYSIGKHKFKVSGSVTNGADGFTPQWGILYFDDATELADIRREYEVSRLAAMIVTLDNYDELFKGASEVEKSALLAEFEAKVNAWIKRANAFVTRMERGKYACLFEVRWLDSLIGEQFSILESIKELKGPGGINSTVSIGIGKGGANPMETFNFAAMSIEMALSRGGDQAVIKDALTFAFYGGKGQAAERNSKVKSRVVANALSELIRDASRVIVMGHKYADFDCLGAAAGIAALTRKLNRPVSIVINADTSLAKAAIKHLKSLPEYDGVFITPQDAMLVSDNRTLLLVADTYNPARVESEALLESCTRVVVIDHHRRGADYIAEAALSFHEPFASSASELVVDLMQYLLEPRDLLKAEAEALLGGIVLDTKNFTFLTGSRTFEAAAFLRRAGADTIEVRKMFRLSFEMSAKKSEIIRGAEIYRGGYVIGEMSGDGNRIVAGSAADDLLNIADIRASFVIYSGKEEVCISARSNGEVNVQLVMEALGGGGTAQSAAVQVKDKTTSELRLELISVLEKFDK
ncbi:MAG: DHH family phosphoesterase [Oscillospiraceae bacterium]|jgi:c-di-AMP phosphodiesterase-like protein|nr:DHH family phosphoesterase [Oscillospiraceae bacterium]